jgi:hypothetical protein
MIRKVAWRRDITYPRYPSLLRFQLEVPSRPHSTWDIWRIIRLAFAVSQRRFKGIRDLFLTEIGYQAVSAEVKFLNLIAEWIHMLEFKD